MIRVVHVITDLIVGGAQANLLRLVEGLDRDEFSHEVVSLKAEVPLAGRLESSGVPVRVVRMRHVDPVAVVRLQRWLRGRGDVVQTWMYHGDLVGGLAAWGAHIPVVWGVQHAWIDPAAMRRATVWTARACARLSRRLPAAIVMVADSARAAHERAGYDPQRMVVIRNGFDTHRFAPDPAARFEVRAGLGIPVEASVVGWAGRWHPDKDHRTLFDAASRIGSRLPASRFVLCGPAIEPGNQALTTLVREAGLEGRCHLLGPRSDIARVLAAFDVCLLSSRTETFTNVVGEAMACAVPCVVTDVGDLAELVGPTGGVVGPGDPAGLAEAASTILELDADRRTRLGAEARRRVQERYSAEVMLGRYAELYRQVARGRTSDPDGALR